MTGYNGTATYTYRADGMRVSKVSLGTTTKYRYDGQMGMQDVEVTGANTVVTNYGLGLGALTLSSEWEPQPSRASRSTILMETTWQR